MLNRILMTIFNKNPILGFQLLCLREHEILICPAVGALFFWNPLLAVMLISKVNLSYENSEALTMLEDAF